MIAHDIRDQRSQWYLAGFNDGYAAARTFSDGGLQLRHPDWSCGHCVYYQRGRREGSRIRYIQKSESSIVPCPS